MVPYTYLVVFTHPRTYQREFYYGVQYGSQANPDNLWKTYFTSSRLIHYRLKRFGKNCFHIEIRKTFDDPMKARLWEEKVLKRMKVVNSDKWLNRNDSMSPPIGKGENNPFYGKKHRRESIEKMIATKKKRYLTDPEYRKRLQDAIKNRDLSFITPEYKKKLSDKKKGKAPFGDCSGINNGMYGKKHSEETRKKLSLHMQKRALLPNPMEGKNHTEQAKKKLSSSRKELRWINKDGKTKAIPNKDIVFWVDAGWKLGRK